MLEVRVQPRARRDAVAGARAGRLLIQVTAPPAGGEANARVLEVLAKTFGVARSRVHLLRGPSGRDKRIRIEGPVRWPETLGPPQV